MEETSPECLLQSTLYIFLLYCSLLFSVQLSEGSGMISCHGANRHCAWVSGWAVAHAVMSVMERQSDQLRAGAESWQVKLRQLTCPVREDPGCSSILMSHSWGKRWGWTCRCGAAMTLSPGQGGMLGNLFITMSWKRRGKSLKIWGDWATECEFQIGSGIQNCL